MRKTILATVVCLMLQPSVTVSNKPEYNIDTNVITAELVTRSTNVVVDVLQNKLNETRKELNQTRDDLRVAAALGQGYNIAQFVATAYSPHDNRNGINSDNTTGITSTGSVAADGTIAVDPRVIPYGSKLIILHEDGSVETGVALDCGGAIKGNKIDIYRNRYSDAVAFGKRNVTVIWK